MGSGDFVAAKILKWGSISVVCLLIIGMLAIYVIYRTISIPNPNTAFQAQTSTVYYSDGKHVLGTFAVQNRHSIPLARCRSRCRTRWSRPRTGRSGPTTASTRRGSSGPPGTICTSSANVQGASTITQQYVKVLYLTQQRTWTRKIKEAFISVKLDQELSASSRSWTGYLNTIYFGRGAYGIDAAAQAFFREPASR